MEMIFEVSSSQSSSSLRDVDIKRLNTQFVAYINFI